MLSADIAAGTVPQTAGNAPQPPQASEPGEAAAAKEARPEGASRSLFSDPVAWGTMALSLGLAVGIFFLLPVLLTRWLDRYIASALASNLVEGFIRLAFVIAYIWGVGFLPEVRRVFAFHGAEHKTVHTYEAGEPLTVEAIQAHTTAHARCGTAFILVVVVISVLFFSLLGRPPLLLRLISRILAIPLIAGIAYEWLKFSARHENKWWMRGFLWPGLFMQRLTTREPDDDMVEVAIAALNRVLKEDGLPVPQELVPVAV
jgi:uncharacterized protein YqhQ